MRPSGSLSIGPAVDTSPHAQPPTPLPPGAASPDVPAVPAVRLTSLVLDRHVLLVVEGECDLAAASQLEACAATVPARARSFALDLSRLEFLDWSGLQGLLALAPAGLVPVLLDPNGAVGCLLDAAAGAGLLPQGLQVVSPSADARRADQP